MESNVLTAQGCGVTLGVGYGETDRIALQRAVDERQGAGGVTIFVPTGVYEFAETINMEVSTAANAAGTVRITGEGDPTLLQRDENNLFVMPEACNGSGVGHVVLEGLHFQGSLEAA